MYEKEFEFLKYHKESIKDLDFDRLFPMMRATVVLNSILNIFLDNDINPFMYLDSLPLLIYKADIKNLVVPANVKYLRHSAIFYCKIKMLAIHNDIKEINDSAISNSEIDMLIIGKNTETFGEDIFYKSVIHSLWIYENSPIDLYIKNGGNNTGTIHEVKYVDKLV